MAAEGIHLLYHNHNCELRHVNAEKRAYDILLEETDPAFVNFEFDSYWFTEGGANALAWMQRLGPRMKLWHINDRGTRITGSAITPILKTDSMELGTGNMDLDSLMAQALAMDVDAVILESTATGWTTLLSRASSSVQNTLHKNSDLPFSHYFLLHYPHKSNAPTPVTPSGTGRCVLRGIFLRYRMWVPGCKVRLLPSGRVTSAVRLQGTVMV